MAVGAGAALIAEEALTPAALQQIFDTFEQQPIWSDLPVILFSSSTSAESLLKELSLKVNATIVERPIRKTILLSAVRGALRARNRQYQTRDLLMQLELADKQKDLFLATLSHELRTPLNSIVGWLKLLRGKTGVSPADTEHALDVIERNAHAQSEIISDILFVSRVVTGKLDLKRAPIDLIGVVTAAVESMQPTFDARGLETEINIEPLFVPISGDADRLQQVFLNLLSNAAKFTEKGGKISVSITNRESQVVVAIADTGRGIAPEFLPYVFERFRQADNEYNRQAGGLGLGLAIVRHLVELHGGSISADSEGMGRGAEFTVTLPTIADSVAEPDARNSAPVGANAESGSFADLRVLLVEDDRDSREMLMTFLGAYGMQVTAVESATEAIEKIKTLRPDLLISDVGLPGKDGYELINTIRTFDENEGGRTPAIALTGYVSNQDRNRALSSGYQEHLAKPIDFDQLVTRISSLVRRENDAA